MTWNGKVAIVTGGAAGIGGATARLFAERGASVVIADMKDGVAEENVAAIRAAGGKAIYVRTDVSSETDVQALLERAVSEYGRVDALINNAGIMHRHERLEDWPIREIRQVLDVNLLSQFLTIHGAAPIMARTGGGTIINIASVGAISAVAYSPTYAASKAGVLGLTRSIAPTLVPLGVRVNAILPSFADTPMTADSPMRATFPMLEPIELAQAILHVAADPALNGAFFAVLKSDKGASLMRLTDPPPMTPAETTPF